MSAQVTNNDKSNYSLSILARMTDPTFKPKLPEIAPAEQTPLVQSLLAIIAQQQVQIAQLVEEIQKLKGTPCKPTIKPSKMDQEAGKADDQATEESKKRRRGRPQRKKTVELTIHEESIVPAEGVPAGAHFKGYKRFVVQDLVIRAHNTCYYLEQWQRAEGGYLTASLPAALRGGHYGPTLVSYLLQQYHHQHVTQPLLLEQLHELGIAMSAGQLNALLSEGHEAFHQEKAAVLHAGMAVSDYLQTDDTGARHGGKNGYCTYIGNELFAWFASTESKSRINFLSLLQAERSDYVVNAGALEYMARQKLPRHQLALLETHGGCFATGKQWEAHLQALGISGARHIAIATEGALVGSLLAHGFPSAMAIVSDDAGQFNVFQHALCWIHAERGINRLIPLNAGHRNAQAWVRQQLWAIYADLKAYKINPNEALNARIRADFDALCTTRTDFASLTQALRRLHRNKAELLLVLDHPELPLHNNLSERDIRDYVKKRKISGGTRSDLGRQCRDTFASLKKTCRKHGISFWAYLKDRLAGTNTIPPLPDYIRQAAQANP